MGGVLRFAQVSSEGRVICVCEMADRGELFDGYKTNDGSVTFRSPPEAASDLSLLTEWVYDEAGGWLWLGERPSEFHIADFERRIWNLDVVAARAAQKLKVDEIRRKRNHEQVTQDGIVIDGDEVSQFNLKAKVEEVRAKIELEIESAPDSLVWRDAYNVTHRWGTLESYYQWLRCCAIIFSERSTRLYAVAWQHKESINTLTGDALLEYDVTQGWPE